MPGLTTTDLDKMFTYHAPTATQAAASDALRAQAQALAALILASVSASAEQTLAVRHVQEGRDVRHRGHRDAHSYERGSGGASPPGAGRAGAQ